LPDRVLIAARGPSAPIAARVAALARWYGVRGETKEVAGGAVTVASLGTPLSAATFQEAPPATLALLDAGDRDLRRYAAAGAALATSSDRARIVAGAGAPAGLYAAESSAESGIRAWATHAVAAAFVAYGDAAVDPAALPELLAAEFVGDSRAIVAGVRALDAAVCVDLSATRAEEWCYWPARDRWAPVPEDQAAEHAESHLLRTLGARLSGIRQPLCGLTTGLDSRVAAVALAELGVGFEGCTWGAPDDEDAVGAAQAAAALGVPHLELQYEETEGADLLARTHAAARWTEGSMHVGFGAVAWPPGPRALVSGAGGQTGRCFYYRDRARRRPPRDLAAAVADPLVERIAGARPEAIDDLRARVAGWVADAERTGHHGWRVLDVVYGEQRARRWLRGTPPHGPAPVVAAFATPEVQRALVSLPLAERMTDGFHRAFIAARRPELLPSRSADDGDPADARPLGRAGRRRHARIAGQWRSRPELRDWIADGVLGHPLAIEGMGERWCGRTRSRYFAGDPAAVERALWLAGPVALAEGLGDLGL
jgi:hypothetical protein